MKRLEDERVMVGILGIILSFIYLTIDPKLATIYSIFTILYGITLADRSWKEVQILGRKFDIMQAFVIVAFTLAIFTIISAFILGMLNPEFKNSYGLQLYQKLQVYSNFPMVRYEEYRLIVYGILIPIIESMFFLSFVLIFFAKLLKVRIRNLPNSWSRLLQHGKAIWLACLVGATASIFHLQVRTKFSYALVVDFIFFTLSALIILRYKHMLEAIGLHQAVNTLIILGGVI